MFRSRKDMLLERSFRSAKIDMSANLGRFLLNKLTEPRYGETRIEVYGEEVLEIWTECGSKRIAEIVHPDTRRGDIWDVRIWRGNFHSGSPMSWGVHSQHDLSGRLV